MKDIELLFFQKTTPNSKYDFNILAIKDIENQWQNIDQEVVELLLIDLGWEKSTRDLFLKLNADLLVDHIDISGIEALNNIICNLPNISSKLLLACLLTSIHWGLDYFQSDILSKDNYKQIIIQNIKPEILQFLKSSQMHRQQILQNTNNYKEWLSKLFISNFKLLQLSHN